MDLSGYTLTTLHQDSELVLCRGRGTARPVPDPPSVLVTMPASEHPAADRVRMLEHEWSLRADLESTWALRPLALARRSRRSLAASLHRLTPLRVDLPHFVFEGPDPGIHRRR